jgi:hypothetical protein
MNEMQYIYRLTLARGDGPNWNRYVDVGTKLWQKLLRAGGGQAGPFWNASGAREFAASVRKSLGENSCRTIRAGRVDASIFLQRPPIETRKGLTADESEVTERALELFESGQGVLMTRLMRGD